MQGESSGAHAVRLDMREMVVLACAALLFAAFALNYGVSSRAPLASAETRFVEHSDHGMQIVPASCPSSPHYLFQCSIVSIISGSPGGGGSPPPPVVNPSNPSPPPPPPVPGCSISAYPSSVAGGNAAILSWSGENVQSCVILKNGALWSTPGYFTSSGPTDWFTDEGQTYTLSCTKYDGGNLSCSTYIPIIRSCTAQYYCAGDDLYYKDAQCIDSFVQHWAWGGGGSSCNPPAPPTGTITANPTLIKTGEMSQISWSTQYTSSCAVTENNPDIADSWIGSSGTRTSSAIHQQTKYTLFCNGYPGSNPSSVTKSVTINIVPIFEEK